MFLSHVKEQGALSTSVIFTVIVYRLITFGVPAELLAPPLAWAAEASELKVIQWSVV